MADQPEIKVIIFDMGGVLLRSDDPRPRTELAESVGLTYAQLDELVFGSPVAQLAERGLATEEEVWAAVAKQLHLPQEQMPEFSRRFFAGDRVDFALVDLIQSLRPDYTTVLLSNTWLVNLMDFLRERHQFPEVFDLVISSAERKMAKPDPAIFRLALELTRALPQEAIFVDDNAANIAAARTLGIHAIHFHSSEQARRELLALVHAPGQPQ